MDNSYEQDYGKDNKYNSYEPEYGTDNMYNSYEQDYGKDNKYNSYEPEYGTDYGMNSYDKKPDLACKECFAVNSNLQTAILDFLAESESVTFSIFFSEDGIGEGFLIGTETKTIEQLCAQIENAVEELGVPLSDELLESFFTFIIGQDFEAEIEELIDCLLKAGIIVDREPPSDTISDNPIITQSNNPITTQSNKAITTQSNNPITTMTTTPSSNVPQSNNIEAAAANTFFSSLSSTLGNILPSNPN